MNNTRGIMSFQMPAYYESLIQFADTTRNTFEQIRNTKPKNEIQVKAALNGFIDNCLFKNCTPNNSYIKALGFELNKK